MEHTIQNDNTNRNKIIVWILYIMTFCLIMVVFPRKGRFPYEFSKGKQWLNDELYAPYDIPIIKTDEEILQEKDSLLRYSPLYFQRNSQTADQAQKQFNQVVSQYVAHLQQTDSVRYASMLSASTIASSVLKEVYDVGIISIPEEYDDRISNEASSPIRLIQDNIGQYADIEDFYSQKSAFEKIRQVIQAVNPNTWNSFVNNINITDFLNPNIVYDASTTDKIRNEAISNVSLTYGVIPVGSIIITRGEIVNKEKFDMLNSFQKEFEHRTDYSGNVFRIIFGQGLLVLFLLSLVFLYVMYHERSMMYAPKKQGLVLMMIAILVSISAYISNTEHITLYIVPFALLPIILQTFFPVGLTIMASITTIVLVGFFTPTAFEFVFLNTIAMAVAIFSSNVLYRRNILFRNTCLIFLAYVLSYIAIYLLQDSPLSNISLKYIFWFAINAGFTLLSYSLIFICEKAFGFLSGIRLFELADTNQPLLRQLSEFAPGSFQHSLQVANLADEVIRKIGGNPLLVRVGALYHDIGKIKNPQYFIENVSGDNPHSLISCDESAEIILKHVTDGVELAQKHRLPKQIIDFIRTHHGTSVVQYFYKMYCQQHPDEEVDITKFTYLGPDPFSKEMVVLMMCDACEAASHSLQQISPETISSMVEGIINYQMGNNSYMQANITCKEITDAKTIIKQKLMNIYHVRVAYPK